jgi:hypothetical protein
MRVVRRTATIRGVELGSAESLAIALHPMELPIVVDAQADADIEACAAGHNGEPPGAGGSSWPRFGPCVPFDASGHVSLTPSFSGHIVFLVRGRNGVSADIRRLHVAYTPVDTYFEVLPPPLAPNERAPTITLQADASRIVGAQAYAIDYAATPNIRVAVMQGGHRVPKHTPQPEALDPQAYGPVRLAVPVTIRTTNTGSAAARLRILVAWDSRFVSS